MILSWIWRNLSCSIGTPFKTCIGWHDHPDLEGPVNLPPSAKECWDTLNEINSEAEFRCMHEQGATLNQSEPGYPSYRDRVYDILWILARHHGGSLEYIENKIRSLGYDYIWLYPLPHDGATDPECITLCRDAQTRETRHYSVGLVLGPATQAQETKAVFQGKGSLAECGFLELK